MSDDLGTIVLIDEFSMRRAAMKALLALWMDPEETEVIEFDMARATIHLEVEPDAQLLLLNVGGGSLEDASNRHNLRLLRSVAPDAPLAIMGERDSPEEIQIAIRLGAKAFLPASLDPRFVKNCLEFLISGGSYFPTSALIAVAEEAMDDGPEDEGGRLAAMARSTPSRRTALTEGGGRSRPRKIDSPTKRDPGPKKAQAEAMMGPKLLRRQEAEPDDGPARFTGIDPNRIAPCGAPERADQRGESAERGPEAFAPGVNEVIDSLTPRQREVLELLAKGASNKEIARKLNTTEPTVKIHVRQIIKRFGVSNRTQVVVSMFEQKDERAPAALAPQPEPAPAPRPSVAG